MAPNTSPDPPPADLSRSPTILLASMFAARRAGDDVLARYYRRRLAAIGIHVTFTVGAVAPADGTVVPAARP
jgi:hypothetical protein